MKKLFDYTPLATFTDLWLLVFRILVGGFMIFGHGLPKFNRLTSGGEIQFADPFGAGPVASMWMAVGAEFGCSILLMLGLFSRWATIPLIITMLVAAFVANGGQPFQKMELALVYLLIYITLFVFGGGKYSLDKMISSRS